jgi:hypothetical protein
VARELAEVHEKRDENDESREGEREREPFPARALVRLPGREGLGKRAQPPQSTGDDAPRPTTNARENATVIPTDATIQGSARRPAVRSPARRSARRSPERRLDEVNAGEGEHSARRSDEYQCQPRRREYHEKWVDQSYRRRYSPRCPTTPQGCSCSRRPSSSCALCVPVAPGTRRSPGRHARRGWGA